MKKEITRINYKDLAEKIVQLIDEKTNNEYYAIIENKWDSFLIFLIRKNNKRIKKSTIYYVCGLTDGYVSGYFANH